MASDVATSSASALSRYACAVLLAGSTFVVLAGGACANDSTASLAAGGLQLTVSPDIRLQSEVLTLSRSRVGVVYRFRNTGAHDVRTLVAFPLPVMQIGPSGSYALLGGDADNVMGFRVSVDGHAIAPKMQIRATRFGIDVTDLLKRYDVPLTMRAPGHGVAALTERLDSLPATAKAELKRYGVVEWIAHLGASPRPIPIAHWNLHITYYWFQAFPAHRSIEVIHRYRPVPRRFFFRSRDLAAATMRKDYCIGSGFARAARALLRRSSDHLLDGYALKYVLSTGSNWLGPIGTFRLIVEKSSPRVVVSLCAPGIKRASPTTLALSRRNFRPGSDLKVLFLEPFAERK